MRALITGVGGFLGRHLARELLRRQATVAGTWVAERPLLDPDIESGVALHEAELLDRDAIDRALAAARPTHVFHLAGLSHVGDSWHRIGDYFRVNVLGSENVVDAAARAGARVVFASSADIYGTVPEPEQPLREDRPASPATPYALTKAAGERFVLAQAGVVVRSFNIIGPGQAPSFALPSFAAQLAAIAAGSAEPVLRVGNLSARRDFVHPADAAIGFALAAERGTSGGVYNLANGRALSIRQALDRLVEAAGLSGRIRLEEDPDKMRPVDVPLLLGDATRLRALGWLPQRSAEQAIDDVWRHALANSLAADAATRQTAPGPVA